MNTTDQEFLIGLFENLSDALAENTALLRELVGWQGAGTQDAPAPASRYMWRGQPCPPSCRECPYENKVVMTDGECDAVEIYPSSAPAAPPPHEVVAAFRNLLDLLNIHGATDGSDYQRHLLELRDVAREALARYDAVTPAQSDAPTTAAEAARMAKLLRDWFYENARRTPCDFNDRAEDADRVAEYLAGMEKK